MKRFLPDSGIAIGPILFIIALLGVIAAVFAAGSSDFGTASVSDRTYNEVYSQANLIRTKINECNLKYGTNNNGDGFPPDPTAPTLVCALICEGDPSTAETGNDCRGGGFPLTLQNLWSGIRATQLPPPSAGFNPWHYTNAGSSGGRCVWTEPSSSSPSNGLLEGLAKVASKFSSQEVVYNAAGASRRLVIWITLPTGTVSNQCQSN